MEITFLPWWAGAIFIIAIVVLFFLSSTVKKAFKSERAKANFGPMGLSGIMVDVICLGVGCALLLNYPHTLPMHAYVVEMFLVLGGVIAILNELHSRRHDSNVAMEILPFVHYILVAIMFCALSFCNLLWGCVWIVITVLLHTIFLVKKS